MARHKTLQCTFKSIDREEVHVYVEHEFESLGNRLVLKKAMEKENYCDFRHSLIVISFLEGNTQQNSFPLKFRHLSNQLFFSQAARELRYRTLIHGGCSYEIL